MMRLLRVADTDSVGSDDNIETQRRFIDLAINPDLLYRVNGQRLDIAAPSHAHFASSRSLVTAIAPQPQLAIEAAPIPTAAELLGRPDMMP
jgi:hypothetical protein